MRLWRLMCSIALSACAGCVHVPDNAAFCAPLTPNVAEHAAEALFQAALVRCVLPMMAQVRVPRLIIHYRFDGHRTYLDANDSHLLTRLRGCATPEAGPTLSFAGKVTIWRPADDK